MNKRHYGRITKQLPAIVETEDGMRLKVVTVDVSVAGVCFQCNIHQRDVMTPGGSFLRNGRPARLVLSLELPDEEQRTSPVKGLCHIAYSRRVSKEKCLIGMRFIEFEQNGGDRLHQFIGNNLASNDIGQSSVCA